MPPRRSQSTGAPLVGTGIQSPGVSVVAQPVDTFVRPAVNTQAEQLAQALGRLSPALGELGNTLQEKENVQQTEAGRVRAAELARAGKDYATEVRAGRLPANNSPFFMAGLHEVQGQNLADRFASDFQVAMDADASLKTSTNLQDFRTFSSRFTSAWAKEHGLDTADTRLLTGFSGKANAWIANYEHAFAAGLAGKSQQQMAEAVYTQIRTHVMSELRRGTSIDAIAADFTSQFKFWTGLGANGRTLNQTQFTAALSAADELSKSSSASDRIAAMRVLDVLRKVPGGPSGAGALPDQPWAAQTWAQALNSVADNVAQGDIRASQAHQAEVLAQGDLIQKDMIAFRSQNRYGSVQDFITRMNVVDPDRVDSLLSLDSAMQAGPYQSNRRLYEHLFHAIWNNGNVTQQSIANSVHQGGLTIADGEDLIGQFTTSREAREGKSPLNDTALTRVLSQIPRLFTQTLPGANGSFFQAENGEAISAVSATLQYDYYNWRTLDPKGQAATASEQIVWLNTHLDLLGQTHRGPYAQPGTLNPIGTVGPARLGRQEWRTKPVVTAEQLSTLVAARKNHSWNRPGPELQKVRFLLEFWGIDETNYLDFIRTQEALLAPATTTPANAAPETQ